MKRITLTNGLQTLVDDCDYTYLSQWKWGFNRGYAVKTSHKGVRSMSRIIARRMGLGIEGMEVDHINVRDPDNKLNNQRLNLRLATHPQNTLNRLPTAANKSGYKGVCWCEENKNWRATIEINGVYCRLGNFDTAVEAAAAYDAAATEHHGDFARINGVTVSFTDPRGTWNSNTSGFRGVSFKRQTGRWVAVIIVNQKQIHLGYFDDKHEAALVYNKAARKHFGPKAYQNQLERIV